MSLWSTMARRAFGGKFFGRGTTEPPDVETVRLREAVLSGDDALIRDAVRDRSPDETRALARHALASRVREAVEILRQCEPCRQLLSGGGYDPVDLLNTLGESIGQPFSGFDIDESGGGGSQRGQGYETRIRFGPLNFLLGTALDGMTIHESQLQVILHELAHAAGDVIPPDGGNPEESQRNQHRITRACLPETYDRISQKPDRQGGCN